MIFSRKFVLLGAIIFFLSISCYGQPGGGGDPGGGEPVPMTGIEILLVAGAALGIKRLFSLKNIKAEK